MRDREVEEAVHREVIGLSARSRLVAQIAVQVADALPIDSPEQLKQVLDERGPLRIGDGERSLSEAAAHLPQALFPVRDVGDLVRKLDGAVGLAVVAGERGLASRNRETNELARLVSTCAADGAPATLIVSTQPPLLGASKEAGNE